MTPLEINTLWNEFRIIILTLATTAGLCGLAWVVEKSTKDRRGTNNETK